MLGYDRPSIHTPATPMHWKRKKKDKRNETKREIKGKWNNLKNKKINKQQPRKHIGRKSKSKQAKNEIKTITKKGKKEKPRRVVWRAMSISIDNIASLLPHILVQWTMGTIEIKALLITIVVLYHDRRQWVHVVFTPYHTLWYLVY